MKYLMIIFFAITLNVFTCAHALDIKSSIQLSPSSHEYKEGDLVEVDIKIWPIENADLDEFKKIEGASLFNGLEITQVNSVETSANNTDVVVVKATAIVSAAASTPGSIHYKDSVINISMPEYKMIPLKTKQADFYILDQSVIGASFIGWALISIFILGAGIYLYKKKFKKRKNDFREQKTYYQELFSSADERKDFEIIYSARKEWIPFLLAETNAHREFYKLMEAHQYRKEWTTDVNMEIKNTFDVIRSSFL